LHASHSQEHQFPLPGRPCCPSSLGAGRRSPGQGNTSAPCCFDRSDRVRCDVIVVLRKHFLEQRYDSDTDLTAGGLALCAGASDTKSRRATRCSPPNASPLISSSRDLSTWILSSRPVWTAHSSISKTRGGPSASVGLNHLRALQRRVEQIPGLHLVAAEDGVLFYGPPQPAPRRAASRRTRCLARIRPTTDDSTWMRNQNRRGRCCPGSVTPGTRLGHRACDDLQHGCGPHQRGPGGSMQRANGGRHGGIRQLRIPLQNRLARASGQLPDGRPTSSTPTISTSPCPQVLSAQITGVGFEAAPLSP